MASLPNCHMFFLISPIICVVTALIFPLVTDPSALYTSVLDQIRWLLLFLLVLLLLAFFLRKKASSSPSSSSSFSSTSTPIPERKYEVFLSFRGTDTRYGFLSHLCLALHQKKIDYFVDEKKLLQGDGIKPTLSAAIKQSIIALIIFSENYASSTWCLEELAHIIECMRNHDQIVIPIFYKIEPSNVRHQKGSYKDAFAQHEKRFDKLRLQKWRAVLKDAADLSGFHSSNYHTEADFIMEIIQYVLKRLDMKIHQSDLKGLVGIQKHIAHLEAFLSKKTQDVLIIGIWGMGGIGKTTIAEVLFNRLYNEYEGRYFLNVREGLDKHGRTQVKKKLLSKLLGEDPDIVMHNGILPNCQRRLQRKKVLVVLDDINRLMQLEILTGGHEWFGPDSRIIITSRNKDIFIKKCDYIYEVTPLGFEEALQLFNLNVALPEVGLDMEQYELSTMVVNYCKGNPLAIKVLAHCLSGREKNEWKSKLKKLDKILDPDVQNVLQLSYNELDYEQQVIFLYLACFFDMKGDDTKERIISLLDDDEYHTIDGLRVLESRALITISSGRGVIMHDLIQKMGCEIARNKCLKNPGQCSHLCNANDIYKVLKNNMGTEEIESINLRMWELKKDLYLTPQSFVRMDNLKLLRFNGEASSFWVYAPEEDFRLPAEIRFLCWDGYSSKSINHLRSCLDNLVELHMRYSCLQKLWDGIQELPSLKVINLSYSKELVELPNLSKAPKLQYVNLAICGSLWYVPLWAPDAWKSKEDDHLHLNSLSTSALQYVLPSLQCLDLFECNRISFGLPDDIDLYLPTLHTLRLCNTKFEALPERITHLAKLTVLDVRHCTCLKYIPELPPSIECFYACGCTSLGTLQFSSNSVHLSRQKNRLHIDLENCMKLSEETLEAVAMHYKLSTQIIISAGQKNSSALLCLIGSKVPECFKSCSATHDLASVPLEVPFYSKAMGFIFCLLTQDKISYHYYFPSRIKCHIELSNVAKVQFIWNIINEPKWLPLNHVCFWYENLLSLEITKELRKIKASVTTDDLCAKIWFELLADGSFLSDVKEWWVYPIFISSEPQNLTH